MGSSREALHLKSVKIRTLGAKLMIVSNLNTITSIGVMIDMAGESEFTEEERRFLQEETTQEESDRIDRIINNMRGMLIALS